MPGFLSTPDCALIAGVVALMLIDIISGYAQAVERNDVQSHKIFVGLFHKFGEILLIVLAVILDIMQSYIDLGYNIPLLMAVLALLIFYEINSILENILKLNPELSAKDIFKIFKIDDKNEG